MREGESTPIGQTAMFTPLLALALLFAPTDSVASTPDSAKAQLLRAVHAYTAPFGAPSEDLQVRTEWADVSGDGVEDALVYLNSPSWCGSGGCTMLVFEAITDSVEMAELGAFRPAAEISMMNGPVTIVDSPNGVWKDLVVEREDGSRVALQFDGETYPMSPAEGLAYDASDSQTVLFADAD